MSLPDECPFCGAGVHGMSGDWVTFSCHTMTQTVADRRQFQSRTCKDAERARLAARVAELEARCKRLEEAGDVLQSAVVGVEGMTHWQWLAAAHEADLKWRSAKEAKP